MTKRQIIEDAKKLPRAEQIDLAMELWEIISPQSDEVPLTDAQAAELDRRLEALERNPDDARPWDEIRDEILRDLQEGR